MPYRPASCWTCGKDLPLDHYWSSVGVSVGLACCSRECFESTEKAWVAERFERPRSHTEECNATNDASAPPRPPRNGGQGGCACEGSES